MQVQAPKGQYRVIGLDHIDTPMTQASFFTRRAPTGNKLNRLKC